VNDLLFLLCTVVQLGGAVRRHCHSTGDMLSTSSDGQHIHNVDMLPPVRLRANRPKSEGSFCGDKMRVKRASSFGVGSTFMLQIFSGGTFNLLLLLT